MSKKKTSDDYEVGYGRPPKNTQFQKGVTGNPRGRPKKPLDFDHELIKESESPVTITENGRPKRVSKHNVVVKQLVKQAATGSTQAQRIYFALRQHALERLALVASPQTSVPLEGKKVEDMTDEELLRLITADPKRREKSKKGARIGCGIKRRSRSVADVSPPPQPPPKE